MYMMETMENLRVVLVSTRNPLNIGAVARAMSNFGALHLRVVHPYEKAFREARSAVGATAVLRNARECDSLQEALEDCALVVGTTAIGHRDIKHPLRSLDKAGPLLRGRLRNQRIAILFGSEKRIVQRGFKLLPLAAAHSNSCGTSVDESGSGRGCVFL